MLKLLCFKIIILYLIIICHKHYLKKCSLKNQFISLLQISFKNVYKLFYKYLIEYFKNSFIIMSLEMILINNFENTKT